MIRTIRKTNVKMSTAVSLALFCLIFSAVSMQAQASCSLPPTTLAENIAELSSLLPGDARGALAVDISDLLAGSSVTEVTDLLNGDGGDPALNEPFSAINELAENVDLAGVMDAALLVQTTDALDSFLLLAKMSCDTIGEVATGPSLAPDGTYGSGAHPMYLDVNGNSLSLLTGGVLIVGELTAVHSVLDVVDGVSSANASDIVPFLSALESGSPFSFVYGLPAMFNSAITPERSLRGAELVSGSVDFTGSNISGRVSFHTSNASSFVDNYNTLDSASGEAPLVLDAPIANGLSQVVVTIPSTPINKSEALLITSRNTLKKLFLGMQAYDYAEDVADPGNPPWLDLVVESEEDVDGSPGSVFIRWEFKDQAAIEAFEANELPAGFALAPCQFLESDAPGYFLALNLYNSGGGSIVDGARAEWDVFVQPPDGDPRPRFMVIDALAEAVSADPVNGLTPAEPLSHEFLGNQVVSYVGKLENDVEIPVFSSSFPKPSGTAPIARFTRQMAIGNDYIYWGHGVLDRVLYNATTFNYDALFADLNQVQITDDSHWKQYLADDPTYVVYYLNTLEYVASPWANLDSPYLDITPEWLSELYGFKNNGNYLTLMRDAVRGSFRGRADALTKFDVENTTPSVYYSFQITDPVAMSAALNLPAGYSLAQTRFFEDIPAEDYYLTLSIHEIEGSVEGTRAEWSVYVDDGSGREHFMIIDLQTEDAAVDPVSMINLPSKVVHDLAGSILSTSLSSLKIDFDASFDTQVVTEEALSLDWIEAGDYVCHINGICDKLFYDGETLDVFVHLPTSVTINTVQTPWNAFINTTPSTVFYRDNSQEYVVKPWHNLKVFVEDPPPPPPCFEGTHTITGAGTLIGRTNHAVDSTYDYFAGGTLSGSDMDFTMHNTIENALGETHIFTAGSFDITTGVGTTTVVGCTGAVLTCAGVDPIIGTPDATTPYTAANLDASDTDNITWDVIQVLTIPGFGDADSVSSFTAVLGSPPVQPEDCSDGVDDDCDGYVDCDDSDCSSDLLCGYPGAANAEAASYGSSSLTGSGTFNALTLLLVPIGAVIFLRVLRSRK
jgi:hypothetical protein